MTKFEYNEQIQQHGCNLLSQLSSECNNKIVMARQGGIIESVVQAMSKFVLNEQIQRNGTTTCGSLAFENTDNLIVLIRQEGIAHVVKTMARCSVSCEGSHERDRSVLQGWVEVVLEAMINFSNQEELQEYGCLALGNLARKSEDRIATIADRGGISLVVEAMEQFPHHEQLTGNGCFALGALAWNNDTRSAVASEGGIDLVIQAMMKFTDNEFLQQSAFVAIGNLVLDSEENRIDLVRHDKIEFLERTMGLFSNFHQRRCEFHWTAFRGFTEVALEAMTKFPNNEQLQLCGCSVIGNWAQYSNETRLCARKGGIDIVARAMNRFSRNEQLQQNGLFALAELGWNDVTRAAIARRGGIRLVALPMMKYIWNEQLQLDGCRALGKLALNVENRDKIVGQRGMKLVVQALEIFFDNGRLCGYACQCLATLAINDSTRAAIARDCGALKATVDTLERKGCFGHWTVVEACWALEALGAASAKNKECIEALNGVEVARDAWKFSLDNHWKRELESSIRWIEHRFIFTSEFLSKYGITRRANRTRR